MKKILFGIILCLAVPAFSKELTVYTSRKEHLVKGVFELYTKKTKTKINYLTGKAGSLIQRIKAEGEKSPADIFMTVDAGNLWFAAQEGILTPLKSKEISKNVPSHLRDPEGKWTGLSIRARTIVYNTDLVKKSDLSTYEDLGNKKWVGKICLRTSKKVYNQSMVAMFIHELGQQKAQKVIEGWVANKPKILPNDVSVLKAVSAGQCGIGIVNTYYYGRLMREKPKLPLALFWPNQKSYGVHVNVSGAGVVASSKNKKEAQKFLEWLSGSEAQKFFAQVNLEYAVNNQVAQAPEVTNWGKFQANKTFNLSYAGKLQGNAVKLMHKARYL